MPEPAPGVFTRVTRYEVSCLPEEDINARPYTLTVEYRGRGLWAVLDGPFALNADGVKDYEPRPSAREETLVADSPKRYQLRGEIVTVLVRPNQKRRTRPAPLFDLPRIGEYAPNNVLIRTADGDLTVRPFRGLRRTHA